MRTIPRSILEEGRVRSQHVGETSGKGSTDAAVPAVRLTSVWVRYGAIVAVRGVDLTIPHGTTTAIIGPNGSGKSTLLNTLSGLVRPTHGVVEVLGEPAARGSRRVAHVLQTTVANESVPLTVRETVRMGAYGRRGAFGRLTAGDRRAVDEGIERMRIGDLVDRQLRELSGGQRQRVYVAQGLAQRADVLLLDEPITGLDLVTQETITQMVDDERAAGRTVVLTTHDVGTAYLADQAVLMATAVVAAGPPAEVLVPEHLTAAYGGHVHLLEDGTVVLDEPHHHDHRYDDQLRG
jgi:ABC-type Mn2+/Zn2+ transport system ATPase subunit